VSTEAVQCHHRHVRLSAPAVLKLGTEADDEQNR
jgi:hypothetical protein